MAANKYFQLMNLEPRAFNYNLTIRQWLEKDFEACILDSDPECHFIHGSHREQMVVSTIFHAT